MEKYLKSSSNILLTDTGLCSGPAPVWFLHIPFQRQTFSAGGPPLLSPAAKSSNGKCQNQTQSGSQQQVDRKINISEDCFIAFRGLLSSPLLPRPPCYHHVVRVSGVEEGVSSALWETLEDHANIYHFVMFLGHYERHNRGSSFEPFGLPSGRALGSLAEILRVVAA